MSKSVFCIATTQGQAERIVERLQNDEFGYSEISVLFPDTSGACLAGGALGLLAGVGTVVIPGLGPLIAAGPVLAALDATTGGVIGGLVGLGIPQIEAKRYEEKLKKGNYLISAHAEAGDELDRARAIFKEVGGEDISSIKEASVATV